MGVNTIKKNLYLNIKSNDVQAKKKLTDMTNRLEQVLFENQLNDNNLYFDEYMDSCLYSKFGFLIQK